MGSSFHNFEWASETLATARNKAAGKPVQNNTRLFQRSDDSIAVKLHAVDVVTINADETWTLRNGGWNTVTTLERIRGYSPAKLFSERGEWFIRLEPNSNDPAPMRYDRTVPKPYMASDPGPEPVRDDSDPRHIAGRTERHLTLTSEYSWRQGADEGVKYTDYYGEEPFADMLSAAGPQPGYGGNGTDKVLKLVDTGIYFGERGDRGWGQMDDGWVAFSGTTGYSHTSKATVDGTLYSYRQCPHCKEFDNTHAEWTHRMEGARWGRNFDQQTGYRNYREMMDTYGSQEAWREAYLTDLRARRAYLKAEREWDQRNRVPFYDGITVDSDGYAPRLRADGPSPAKLRRHEASVKKMKAKIDKYVNGFIAALKDGKVGMPGAGDCWYCSMHRADTGQVLGDAMDTLHSDGSVSIEQAHSHLIEHMKDRYYVPSLAVNALRERGYKDVGIYFHLDMDADAGTMGKSDGRYDGVKRDMVKYMSKRLVPAAPTK